MECACFPSIRDESISLKDKQRIDGTSKREKTRSDTRGDIYIFPFPLIIETFSLLLLDNYQTGVM